jgi:hypothetical protein
VTFPPTGANAWFGAGNGTAYIDAGAAALTVTGGEAFLMNDVGHTDGEVEAVLRAGGTNGRCKLALRSQNDISSYLFLDGNPTAPYKYRLRSRAGGTTTDLGKLEAVPTAGDVIKVRLSGTTATVWINGVQSLSVTVPPPAAGQTNYGFIAYSATVSQRWESIKVSALA